MDKTSLIRDCARDKQELQKQIDKQQSEFEKLKKQMKKIEGKLQETTALLETKVDQEELEDIKDLVLQLPKVEDVEDLKAYIVENIENFSSDNKAFHKDFKTQNEIIRRYDEVIAQKVAKVTLQQEVNVSNAKLETRIKEVTSMISSTNGDVKSNYKEFDAFQ